MAGPRRNANNRGVPGRMEVEWKMLGLVLSYGNIAKFLDGSHIIYYFIPS